MPRRGLQHSDRVPPSTRTHTPTPTQAQCSGAGEGGVFVCGCVAENPPCHLGQQHTFTRMRTVAATCMGNNPRMNKHTNTNTHTRLTIWLIMRREISHELCQSLYDSLKEWHYRNARMTVSTWVRSVEESHCFQYKKLKITIVLACKLWLHKTSTDGSHVDILPLFYTNKWWLKPVCLIVKTLSIN